MILRPRDGELLAGGSWCCVRLGSFHHLFEPKGLPANSIGSKGGRSLYVAEVMALFDHIIESAKIGLRKPDPRIYRMMTEALGVNPEHCVYLDDLGINLKPAREMGMTTIKVLNAPQAIAELERATGLSLR